MWTTNNILAYYLKILRTAEQVTDNRESVIKKANLYFEKNVAVLVLPDALQQYGPKRQFHFTENFNGEVSGIVFTTTPDNLKGIRTKYTADLKTSSNTCAVITNFHPEVFQSLNPAWARTAYATHLYQDSAYDISLQEVVDYSEYFLDTVIYKNSGKKVKGSSFHNKMTIVNEIMFKKISRRIYEEFGIIIDKKWFERKVYSALLKEYDSEMAIKTWEKMKFPTTKDMIKLPEFISEEDIDTMILKILVASYVY